VSWACDTITVRHRHTQPDAPVEQDPTRSVAPVSMKLWVEPESRRAHREMSPTLTVTCIVQVQIVTSTERRDNDAKVVFECNKWSRTLDLIGTAGV
jgi:hypothetical protein